MVKFWDLKPLYNASANTMFYSGLLYDLVKGHFCLLESSPPEIVSVTRI